MCRLNIKHITYVHSFITLILLFLSGCESPDGVSSSAQYFPLAVGNKWYYNTNVYPGSSVDEIWEITGTQTISGINYYKLISYNLGNGYKDTSYYRYDNDILFYRTNNYGEYIIADFSLHLHDTVYWALSGSVTEKTKNLITFSTPFEADYGYSVTYINGLGMTNSVQNGFIYYSHKLIKAEISNSYY